MSSSNKANLGNQNKTPQKKGQLCSGSHLLTSSITSIWNNKNIRFQQQDSQVKKATPKSKQQSILQQQSDKVIMSRKQLLQFTKKFAMSKIDYEQQIQKLKQDCVNKGKRIEILEQQNGELRNQQDYLIKVMQQLRDRHILQISNLNSKHDNLIIMKQGEIDHLAHQITKVRQWLQQEKSQSKRCIEFLKIKDQIIENLEWDVLKYKNQIKLLKDPLERTGMLNNYSTNNTIKIIDNTLNATSRRANHSSKKIILRRDKKNDHSFFKQNLGSTKKVELDTKHKQTEQITKLARLANALRVEKVKLQDEKIQIFSKYREATMENQTLKKRLQRIEKEKGEENKIKKSIYQLDQITKRIKQTQVDKQNLLVTKCIFLEKHIQKLAKQLSEVKSSQILAISKFSEQLLQDQLL